MRLSENTVLITGGASGIGKALAETFLFHRNTVIVCGRSRDKLDALKAQYPEIHTIHCDVTNSDQVKAMKTEIEISFAGFNVLINNAGIQQSLDFYQDESLLEKIDTEINTNFRAVVYLTGLFMPLLKLQPAASIINISSLLSVIPKKSAPVYCATKAAMHAFSQSLRYQLEKKRIKVFEVITPLVDTNMTKNQKTVGKRIPPDELVQEIFDGLERDLFEIHPGISKMVLFVHRFFPRIMRNIAKKR
jgi:short-subunit dehydrogenase involved in D-alanine esterification of teichoic acids